MIVTEYYSVQLQCKIAKKKHRALQSDLMSEFHTSKDQFLSK